MCLYHCCLGCNLELHKPNRLFDNSNTPCRYVNEMRISSWQKSSLKGCFDFHHFGIQLSDSTAVRSLFGSQWVKDKVHPSAPVSVRRVLTSQHHLSPLPACTARRLADKFTLPTHLPLLHHLFRRTTRNPLDRRLTTNTMNYYPQITRILSILLSKENDIVLRNGG